MQTGIVQPSGPSIHCLIIFGSMCARYTASGGAAKRLVTITCVSLSVFNVSLLIAYSLSSNVSLLIAFFLSSVVPLRPELDPAGRNFFRGPFAALPTTDRWLQCRLSRDGVDV